MVKRFVRVPSPLFVAIAAAISAATCVAAALAAEPVKVGSIDASFCPASSASCAAAAVQSYSYEVNAELGRARLVVYVNDGRDNVSEGLAGPSTENFLVQGLRYDASSAQILYRAPGSEREVACATIGSKRGLLGRHAAIQQTGDCVVTHSLSTIAHDDGFNVTRSQQLDFYFAVRGQ